MPRITVVRSATEGRCAVFVGVICSVRERNRWPKIMTSTRARLSLRAVGNCPHRNAPRTPRVQPPAERQQQTKLAVLPATEREQIHPRVRAFFAERPDIPEALNEP
jgi:hypothetical protein